MDDRPGNSGSDAHAKARKKQSGQKRADDTDHDIAKQAKAKALDDQPGKPTGHGTDEENDKQTFNSHSGSFPLNARRSALKHDRPNQQTQPC